ncbi:MAG: hypothetical protein FJZ63_02150 [Chlamydiae bacterium]|nr:hypothetical protein [Chlamydiota bacterium]
MTEEVKTNDGTSKDVTANDALHAASDLTIIGAKNFWQKLMAKSWDEWYKIARFFFWIVLVVAVGMFAVNQYLTYQYSSQLLQTPCQLCKQLNEKQAMCISGCFVTRIKIFPDGNGGWKYENGSLYAGSTTGFQPSPNFSAYIGNASENHTLENSSGRYTQIFNTTLSLDDFYG